MATFAELQERVERRVIDLPTAVQTEVGSLIDKAVKSAQMRRNFEVMKAQAEYVTTADTTLLGALPERFKTFRDRPFLTTYLGRVRKLVYGTGVYTLPPSISPGQSGFPRVIMRDLPNPANTGNLLVHPKSDALSDWPDGLYRISVPYWQMARSLIDSPTESNWFTEYGEEYIEAQATSDAFMLNWDESRAMMWQKTADKKFAELVTYDAINRIAGMQTLVPHLDVNETLTTE
jgi:hypothetical protein